MAIKKCISIAMILILKLHTWGLAAQSLLPQVTNDPIALDTSVRYGTLDNGFTYYIKKTQDPKKEVYMKLAVKAGSFFETRSQEGYAHLLEHVALFNKNPTDFHARVKYQGMIPRAQTGQVVTKYQIVIPDANNEKIALGLNALKSWAAEIKFDQSQVAVQRGAVLGEMRTKNPYQEWLNKKYGEILLQNVEFPIYSKESIVKNIKHFNMGPLKKFYKDWYRPDRQAAIIVGDINLDSIQILIEKNFSDLNNPKNQKDDEDIIKRFAIELKGNNQYVTFKDSIDPGRRLTMFIKEKNYDYNKISKRDFYHMFLQKMVNYIAEKRSQKFQKQYDPPFANYINRHTTSNGFKEQVVVSAMEVNLDDHPTAIDKQIYAALTGYKSLFSGITDQEVQEARKILKSEFRMAYQNNVNLAEAYLENFIQGSAVPSTKTQTELYDLLSTIKVNEVQEFADKKASLLENKDFIFINIPKNSLPGTKKMIDLFEEVANTPIAFNPPILNMELSDSILKFSGGSHTKVDASTNLIGVTRVKLTNGIDVWLKPSKPRSEVFKNQIEILGFKPLVTGHNNKNIRSKILAHSYASYSGTGGFNKFQVAHYLEAHHLKLHFGTDENDFVIEGTFKEKNLEDFFKLFFLKIEEPDKDTAAFTSWKEKEKALLAIRGGSDFFRGEIKKIWYPDAPSVDKEILDTISRELLLSEYKKHFSDFKNYTFIISGDFTTDLLLKKVQKYFAALPVSKKEDDLPPVSKAFSLRKRNDTIRLERLNQAFAEVYYPVKIKTPVDSKSQVILDIINSGFNEQINKRLRIGSYSPRASGYWLDKKKGIYTFFINFDSELGNEQRMLDYAEEEVMKFQKTGVNQDWLDATINLKLNEYQRNINSFGYFNFWPDYLKNTIKNKENPEDWILQYPSLLKNFISLEEVNEAIQNYLSTAYQQTFLILPKETVY